MMKKILLGLSCLLVSISGQATAAPFVEQINTGPGFATPFPGCCIWSPNTIGWYWSPTPAFNANISNGQTVYLSNVQTQLADLLNGINNDFTMTVSVFTDRPAAGGSLIDSFSFNAFGVNIPQGGFRGTGFATPVALVAGTPYFFGFSGWGAVAGPGTGGGSNWTLDSNTGLAAAGARSLGVGYTGATWETVLGSDDTSPTSTPTIRFLYDTDAPGTPGGPAAAVVPLPGALPLMLSALGLFTLCAGRRRRA
ncbi:MAG: hypothetical protein H7125_16135 [Proteobacteria bacterium]|nr:hypothetical protein [Burkholderiales bacterium]